MTGTARAGRVLLTGADGYLGRRLAARLLADTDDRLVLTVRAGDRTEFATKEARLRQTLRDGGPGTPPIADQTLTDRVEVVAADLRDDRPFADVDASTVTTVVHTAARTAFTVERPVAAAINVAGTRRVAEFARDCPKLERLLVLSTIFSAGRHVDTVPEAPLNADPGFVNHYEWSKHTAEQELLTDFADLPLSIARLPTIVADDDSGAVTQYNVFHNTLKLFFYGLLTLMPGDPATRQYFATADFASRGLARLARPDTPPGIYHVSPAPAETLTLSEVIDTVFEVFETDPGFGRKRLPRPQFCDHGSFRLLADAASGLGASPMSQAVGSVAPFAEQMFLNKDFDNSRLREVWPDYPVSDQRRLVAATCSYLVDTRWGRRTATEGPAHEGDNR